MGETLDLIMFAKFPESISRVRAVGNSRVEPRWLLIFLLLITLVSGSSVFGQTGSITINTGTTGVAIPSTLFGQFFEEINLAGEGGLYAELIRNRSFANSTSPDYWTLVTQLTASGTM